MAETRERFDRYFREGGVRLIRETGAGPAARENAEPAIERDGLKRRTVVSMHNGFKVVFGL